jgi:hypothetical protein
MAIKFEEFKKQFKNKINWDKYKKAIKIKSIQYKKIKNFLNSKTNSELYLLETKFLSWEEKYEERFYKKGIQTCSNIFSKLMNVTADLGTEKDPKDEMFLTRRWQWKDYIFEQYNGQGTFFRIIKNNKTIFQTT